MTNTVNTVEFGIENLHIAEFNEDGVSYKTPVAVKGTVEIKLKKKIEDVTLYADNGVYFSLNANNGYEGELSIYNFDDEFKINYFGYKKDANGVLVEPNILYPKPVALLFKIKGDKEDRATVLFNCVFGKPDSNFKTIEDKLEVEALNVEFKAVPVEFPKFDDKVIQASTVDKDKKKTWFTKVYIPSKEAGQV